MNPNKHLLDDTEPLAGVFLCLDFVLSVIELVKV